MLDVDLARAIDRQRQYSGPFLVARSLTKYAEANGHLLGLFCTCTDSRAHELKPQTLKCTTYTPIHIYRIDSMFVEYLAFAEIATDFKK
jgi:hypothetical protein